METTEQKIWICWPSGAMMSKIHGDVVVFLTSLIWPVADDEFVSRQSENKERVDGLVVVTFLLTVVVAFNLRFVVSLRVVVVIFALGVVVGFNVVIDLRVVLSVDCWAFCSNGIITLIRNSQKDDTNYYQVWKNPETSS